MQKVNAMVGKRRRNHQARNTRKFRKHHLSSKKSEGRKDMPIT
jgi:hypothetical protein